MEKVPYTPVPVIFAGTTGERKEVIRLALPTYVLQGINRFTYNDKKDGSPRAACIIHYMGQFPERDTGAIGNSCQNVFGDVELFDAAAKGRPDAELIGKELQIFYDDNKRMVHISIGK